MDDDQAIARVGLLAAGAAHELASPLATLAVILSDWKHAARLRTDELLSADVARMQAEVGRCQGIVAELLRALGCDGARGGSVSTVSRFLDETIRAWQTVRRPHRFEYRNRLEENGKILADLLLRQVLFSVLDNAFEASPHWIGAEVMGRGSFVLICVSDLGSGFAPEMLENLGEVGVSTKGRGTGLFLARQILQRIGGRVTARNRMDQGAVVELWLPLTALSVETGR